MSALAIFAFLCALAWGPVAAVAHVYGWPFYFVMFGLAVCVLVAVIVWIVNEEARPDGAGTGFEDRRGGGAHGEA